MSNRLAYETSPYLLQHKDNPVDWYPWCEEAFQKAKREDKPVFLSIGYSACHWCHVFAHESFEDSEIADILNKHFVSVKVDREERPDIDSVYMAFCQAFTGSGGWPTSIFMTADKHPFFAGTYFPKTTRGSFIGFKELLLAIQKSWSSHRAALLQRGEQIVNYLSTPGSEQTSDTDLISKATKQFEQLYDKDYGGFGSAPKFPSPHNLLFLLDCYEKLKEPACLNMAQHTLMQMYRGGLFDHIGFGFCRYSTDKKYLVPHFEKMLYDNALLIEAYCRLYSITKNPLHLETAQKTADFVLRDMTSPQGGFFSSLDADSDDKEGKYYLFTPDEVIQELKENGHAFCKHFDITKKGNFEGENIPNLLNSNPQDSSFEHLLPKLEQYRKRRYSLHRDEKILTFQNSLMITAMCRLYLVSRQQKYLQSALAAHRFIQQNLCNGDNLFVSCHMQKRGEKGFLDDYAAYIRALLSLYRATLEQEYLSKAEHLINKVTKDFSDPKGGFYLYSSAHEQLPLRPKETYDGAVPSGNSLMAYNLVCLHTLTQKDEYSAPLQRQLDFMSAAASSYPVGHAMFLRALLQHSSPSIKITVVSDEHTDKNTLAVALPPYAFVNFLPCPTKEYPLKNNRTTYYVCRGHSCLPAANDLGAVQAE